MPDFQKQLQAKLGTAYTLDRELGGGGMSRVFVARDEALDRDVVIKVLLPELSATLSVERFSREIRLAAALQEPHIVPVLSSGVTSDGLPYYTMPFVRGDSLRARLAAGNLPVDEALGILRNVAQALAYAHDHGIVHRDIKPENVLLSSGTAVVTDFGIAKALEAAKTQAPGGTLTQVGTSLGTPAYMAPEQAVGDDVDARADLYAWGVMAYELLTGKHPFSGKTTAQQLVAAHIVEMPRALDAVNDALPLEVANLVMQCLQKTPSDRPSSAHEIVARLSQPMVFTSGSQQTTTRPSASAASAAAPSGALSRSARFMRVSGLATAGLAVLAAVALYARRGTPEAESANRTVVVVPFDNLGDSTDTYFVEGVSEEIGSQLARIPGLQVIGRNGVQRFRGSGKSPREIATELGAAYVLSGSVRWARQSGATSIDGDTRVRIVPALLNVETGVQEWGESYNERLTDVFTVQANVAERVAAALSVKLGATQQAVLRRKDSDSPEARDAQLLGRHFLQQRGLPNLRRAVAEFTRAIGQDSTYARAWAGYAEAYGLLPAYFDTVSSRHAIAESKRAAKLAVQLDSMLPEAQVALSRALTSNFELNTALQVIDRAILLDPSSALAHQQRSETLSALGRTSEAFAAIEQAIAVDALVPVLHVNAATLYMGRLQLDSALDAVNRAIALDVDKSTFWHGMRWGILAERGERDKAIQSCQIFIGEAAPCVILTPHNPPTAAERAEGVRLLEATTSGTQTPVWMSPSLQALFWATFDRPDDAFARLREAYDTRDSNLLNLSLWPPFNKLHGDLRWDALMRDIRK